MLSIIIWVTFSTLPLFPFLFPFSLGLGSEFSNHETVTSHLLILSSFSSLYHRIRISVRIVSFYLWQVAASDTDTEIIHCLFGLGSENGPEFVGIGGIFTVHSFVMVLELPLPKKIPSNCPSLVSFLNFSRLTLMSLIC